MTPEQIDELDGRELNWAVCRALGWEYDSLGWYRLETFPKPPSPSKVYGNPPSYLDDGSAFGLLKTIRGLRVDIGSASLTVWRSCTVTDTSINAHHPPEFIVSGPLEDSATIMCRAFLKLKESN